MRIGARTKAALAVTDVPSDINAGPIVYSGADRRLDRHARRQIGRGRERTSRKNNRCSASNHTNPLHPVSLYADRFCGGLLFNDWSDPPTRG